MPKFDKTFCSQCGREFGPGDSGYSHCRQHSAEGLLSHPRFTLGEDDTGGPCFFWVNPWSGENQKIASLWWPTHPAEATEAIEKLFERLQLSAVNPIVKE